MAVFKCKMCGGSLEITDDQSVATCEYCGTQQTLPKANDDVLANLFNRANNLRLKNEFDKAQEIYEKIINNGSTDSEAFWGVVLCKYGIEYVEDPTTYKRIPTCHRTQLESVFVDVDYQSALQHSDSNQRSIYEHEASEIDKLQKDILSIVNSEKPFDVFICYKETNSDGSRSKDSVIANDIYYQLTQEGFKVFYAAVTLEDKLGQEYEPYIFAALNSAKVMLVIGTKPEHFDAVWVRNEWSRFLKIIKNDRSRLLIPCFGDMDAYNLPEEFSHLQAQDMSKIGFINDVVRGIKKVIKPVNEERQQGRQMPSGTVSTSEASIAPLIRRMYLFLEDGEFSRADEFCEQILNVNPECGEAYVGKLLVEYGCKTRDDLASLDKPIDISKNYAKILRFGNEEERKHILSINEIITDRIEQQKRITHEVVVANAYFRLICPHCGQELFYTHRQIGPDGSITCLLCNEVFFTSITDMDIYEQKEKTESRLAFLYQDSCETFETASSQLVWKNLLQEFKSYGNYKDSKRLAQICRDHIK